MPRILHGILVDSSKDKRSKPTNVQANYSDERCEEDSTSGYKIEIRFQPRKTRALSLDIASLSVEQYIRDSSDECSY